MTQTHTNDRRLIIYDGPTRRKQLLRIGSELYSGVTNHLLATAVPRYLYAIAPLLDNSTVDFANPQLTTGLRL